MELRKPLITELQLRVLHERVKPLMKLLKETFPNKSGQNAETAWRFPKMHKLLELGYNVFKWGMLLNTSCQSGERAHTSLTKKAYLQTNCTKPHKQMVERHLRRLGAKRRSENIELLIRKNPNHPLAWEGLDPKWREKRRFAANKAKRVIFDMYLTTI